MTSMSEAKFSGLSGLQNFHGLNSRAGGSQLSSGTTISAATITQGDGLHGISQDRMIHSIGIVKEILQSNMQLRDDLLGLT
jgi:hypothetical protein